MSRGTPQAHARRRVGIREAAGTASGSAVLVTRPANIHYLTGLRPAGAALLLPPGPAGEAGEDLLILPPGPASVEPDREVTPLAGTLPAIPTDPEPRLSRVFHPEPLLEAARLVRTAGAGALAVEEHHLTVTRHRALTAALGGAPLVDLGCAVERRRLVKDEWELDALRTAAEITDRALGELLESILVGRTERHLALELERRLVDHGAEAPALPTSVGSGPHSGLPDHRPTDRRVEEGDFLTVRLGARHGGYGCQIARTFVIGGRPADWQIELHELVFAAQRAGREALRPGVECREVDRAARSVLEAAGHGPAPGTSTGHGVGLEIGEDPRLSPVAMGRLGPRVPVTVEPGVHLPGRGGVRIDDTLVVRPEADGGPELLTITTKELLAL
ncbi:M24 family metallopeptidase [Streptomyces alkaliphilus]|uniref:M24 family metallopeptidase n=1 Tax=Streptomyces alkaliphilus TaxID=1472722 RepID=A0A7W3TBY5_9ACTN|nr:M24 family metallopeptidase [Streptomyces alkaliphilus]MBB0243952.1 M24 family metallopeptidase [Streptomyces alkaliphilus]